MRRIASEAEAEQLVFLATSLPAPRGQLLSEIAEQLPSGGESVNDDDARDRCGKAKNWLTKYKAKHKTKGSCTGC